MKIVTVVVLASFLAVGLFAQQPPDGKPASTTAGTPQNSSTSGTTSNGNAEVLNDMQGIDFGPYLSKVVEKVRKKWYARIPSQARPPKSKSGIVFIEFHILRDGHVTGLKIATWSGEKHLDRAAWKGITASAPFAPLPEHYTAPFLALRFRFYYNPKKGAVEDPTKDMAH
jgi:TonB family protein